MSASVQPNWFRLGKLSDDELMEIFRQVYRAGVETSFVLIYAEAMLHATRRDFMLLRPASLVLVGKYRLNRYLLQEAA